MTQQLRREVRIPVYWLVVGVAVVFVSPIASIWTSVQIAQNNTRRTLAEQQRVQAAAQQEARKVGCSFLAASLDVYVETPPISDTGRNLQQSYLQLYRVSQCQPSRDK